MKVPFPSVIVRNRLAIIILLHAIFAAGSLCFSFLLRFDFTLGIEPYPMLFFLSLPINIAIFLAFSGVFNLYQGIWRYVSVEDLKDIVAASALASLVFMFIIIFSGKFEGYPRSIYVMNFAFFVIFSGGTRFTIRVFRESFAPQSDTAKNVLIIGAGSAGNDVVKALKTAKLKDYVPVGFIDRDKSTHGKRMQGLKVLGDLKSMKSQIKKHRVHEVFIAIPEATNRTVKEIMQAAKIPEWEVKFKIVPSMMDIMSGKLRINQIRDVSINDLLSRPNITLDDTHVRKQLTAKTVLITGAGGSIGSEICYQVAAYKPARMILLDAGEENAYHIDQGIKKRHSDEVAIHTVVGNIADNGFMDLLLREHKVDFIFHAAAYKHVHLMEWNPLACIKNNVMATANLAAYAERYGVKQFVMISTDKAVNPRGLMGISKRIAERVVLERDPSGTLFNVVRFGNVLGSSGSVIPHFQRLIREGGPITVTSPEAKRYFMSIPEAVQLVLQASTLNQSNTIFLLDMGEPVFIADLAKNLIELSGLKVGEDIEIEYTGLRAGEKLFEELLTESEDIVKTPFEKIRMQKNKNFDPDKVNKFVHDLRTIVELGNVKTLYDNMSDLVPEMTGPDFKEFRENMFA
ncbi:MAG: NAD-dependent epimerase/dehydratase family protein [Chitinivibrionales bacterium]|nr:NAD-dependent epimerase/dehydratase family protein [Chitinivibrionales bacterium]